MSGKNIIYVDKKTESYPIWLAEMKYDKSKSLRDNYIDNALKPYSQNNMHYTIHEQQQRLQLEESKKNNDKNKKVKKKSWRDYVKFIL